MVSTRHHPRQFPEPASPNTRSTPSKSAKSSRPSSPTSASSTTGSVKESVTESVTNAVNAVTRTAKSPTRVTRKRRTRSTSSPLYSHLVDRWLVIWLYISIPLVLWDVGYVFFRPYTMPGGWLHSPFYTPYGFYGTVDYMYGWPAYNDGVGFTAAQSALNVLEWIMYVYYVFVVASQDVGTGWWKFWEKSFWTENAVVQGEGLALATLVCFSGAVMTFSKTALYCESASFIRMLFRAN